jgi:hypothetical protein
MFKEEEQKLINYKKSYEDLAISIQNLDDAIMAGFQKAKQEEKRKPKRHKWIFTLAAAAVFLVGFFTTVRVSPTFAGYLTNIPGLEKIVEMIHYDKGKIAAIENDYYQMLGASEEKSGLKVTIDGAIADENGIVLFYSLQSKKPLKKIYIEKAELKSLKGENLDHGSTTYGSSHLSDKGEQNYRGMIEYFFNTPISSKNLTVKLKIAGDINDEYQIPIHLKKEIKRKKTYELNQTVVVEGQKLTVLRAVIQPLRVSIHIKKDPSNSKKIMNIDDLRLVDEHGETWSTVSNGTSGSKISEEEEVIYLQSNYFRQPKELYLTFTKLQALNKEDAFVMVDIENGQILKQPKGNIIQDAKVEGSYIDFLLSLEKDFSYFPFSNIKDVNGQEVKWESSYSQTISDDGHKKLGINIPNLKKQQGPITFELNYYPTWIEGDVSIKIK